MAFTQNISRLKWKPLGPYELPIGTADSGEWTANGLGWIESLEVVGKKEKWLYAGSNVGGLFVSRNKGKTWKFRFDLDRVCGVWDIVVDNKKKKRLWVATGTNTWDYNWGHGVLYSKNGGRSWQPTGLRFKPTDKEVVYALERSTVNPNLFVACTETDVYASYDATDTWTKILDHEDKERITFRHLVLDDQDEQRMIASGAELFFTEDGGKSWQNRSTKLTFWPDRKSAKDSLPSRFAVTVNPQNHNQVMVVYSYKRISYIDRSDDFGKTWYRVLKAREFDRVDLNHAEIVWHPTDSNTVLVGSVRLYKSDNQGKTFDLVSVPNYKHRQFMHDDIRALSILNSGSIWVGNDGGVSLSTDSGKSWIDKSGRGLQVAQFYDIAVDKGRLVGGCQDMSTLLYYGETWHHTSAIYGDGGMNLIQDSTLYVMQNGMRIRKGSFSNKRWTTIYTPFVPNRFKYPFLFSPLDSTRLWATDHDLWELKPNRKWENLTRDIPHSETKIVALNVNDSKGETLFLAKDQPTWISDKEGLKKRFFKGTLKDSTYQWQDITENLPILAWREITYITSDPNDVNTLYVTLYGFDDGETVHAVYKSEDRGDTWENYSEGLPNLNGLKLILYRSELFLATDQGIYHRNKNDIEWQKLGRKIPNGHFIDIEVDETIHRLYGASFGNGVWYLDLPNKWRENE